MGEAVPTSAARPTAAPIRRARVFGDRKRQLGLGGDEPVETTDADGDPVTVLFTAESTRYDEDDDPTSTRYRTLSTVRSSRTSDSSTRSISTELGGIGGLTSTGTSLTDTLTTTTSSSSTTTSSSSTTSSSPTSTSSSSTRSSSSRSSTSSSTRRSSSSDTSGNSVDTDTGAAMSTLPSSSPSASPSASNLESGSHTNTGAIAGGVVGGVVGAILLAALLAMLFICLRKRRRTNTAPEMAHQTNYPATTGPASYGGATQYGAQPSEPNYDTRGYPASVNTAASPFGAAAANYEEQPSYAPTHATTSEIAPPVAAAGLAGTGAGVAAARRPSVAQRRGTITRTNEPQSPSERAAAADEVVGMHPSPPQSPAYTQAYEQPAAPVSPPRAAAFERTSYDQGSYDRPHSNVYDQDDPSVWPSSYMDSWVGGENPYSAAGVSHAGHGTEEPPPPTAFHMRPGQTMPTGASSMSPVGAFTQPFSATNGSTTAAQRSTRAARDAAARSIR